MKRITVRVPDSMVSELDELTDEEFYPNRSEAVRAALRAQLVEADATDLPAPRTDRRDPRQQRALESVRSQGADD